MRAGAFVFSFFAVLALCAAPLDAARADEPSCTLDAPVSAAAGKFFNITWSFSGGLSAKVVREDRRGRDERVTVGMMTVPIGMLRAWATNVLGPHTYIMTVAGANGATGKCKAVVDFTYARKAVSGYDIVVVAGQSNASGKGVGPFDRLNPALLADNVVQIGRYGASNLQIVPVGYWKAGTLYDGLQFWTGAEDDTEMGFALSFAQNYVKNGQLGDGRQLLIVPAAHGGTSILRWLERDDRHEMPGDRETLYDDMIDRVNFVKSLPGDSRVVAFLWQQGENDVLRTEKGDPQMSATIYQADLAEFFARVRTDMAASPQFPILAGLMVPHWLADDGTGFAIKHEIEAGIGKVTKAEGFAATVPSKRLTSNAQIGHPRGGDLHFNAQSQMELGLRYFRGWLSLESEGLH